MPRYILKNVKTEELSDYWGSYDEMKSYIVENPDLQVVIGSPKFSSGGSITDNTNKIPDGFKDRLREMKKKHPDSTGIDHLL